MTKSISFLSAEGSFWIGNFICGEVKNVGILAYSEAFDEMARKIYMQKPVDLYGVTPYEGFILFHILPLRQNIS